MPEFLCFGETEARSGGAGKGTSVVLWLEAEGTPVTWGWGTLLSPLTPSHAQGTWRTRGVNTSKSDRRCRVGRRSRSLSPFQHTLFPLTLRRLGRFPRTLFVICLEINFKFLL